MKLASRLVMGFAMGATALTGLAGMVQAQDTRMTTSLFTQEFDFDQGDDVTASGLGYELEGAYASGFAYELDLAAGDVGDLGLTQGSMDVKYELSGLAGPALRYEYAKLGGEDREATLAGLAGSYTAGDVAVDGSALADLDEDDRYRFEVGAAFFLTDDLELDADYARIEAGDDGSDTDLYEVGARYNLAGDLYGDVSVRHETTEAYDATGYGAGLSLDF